MKHKPWNQERRVALRWMCPILFALIAVCPLTAWAGPNDKTPTLPEIIERVHAAEKLTSSMEMFVHADYDNPNPFNSPRAKKPAAVTTSARFHVVLQGDLWYLTQQSKLLNDDGTNGELTTIMAYDGQNTRTAYDHLDKRTAKNRLYVDSGCRQADRVFRANTFLYAGWNLPVPLSAFLAAKKGQFDVQISWQVEGEESVNGLQCLRLRNELRHSGHVTQVAHFWAAIDRNYLPIKMDCFHPDFSNKLPVGTGQVSDLKEIAPGAWLPSRIRTVSYSPPETKEGRLVLTQKIDLFLDKAILNPTHRPEFFRTIRFPRNGL